LNTNNTPVKLEAVRPKIDGDPIGNSNKVYKNRDFRPITRYYI